MDMHNLDFAYVFSHLVVESARPNKWVERNLWHKNNNNSSCTSTTEGKSIQLAVHWVFKADCVRSCSFQCRRRHRYSTHLTCTLSFEFAQSDHALSTRPPPESCTTLMHAPLRDTRRQRNRFKLAIRHGCRHGSFVKRSNLFNKYFDGELISLLAGSIFVLFEFLLSCLSLAVC